MNYGSDPADQIVRFTLEGTEVALKLSGLAAKNFALFVYAVLKDQKKTHGKTRLVRMLREQRPFKFFNLPATHMKDFVREAKEHGLLYVPIRNKQKGDHIELVVFADDATKIQRIYDNLGLDYVKAEAGEATLEKAAEQEQQAPAASAPSRTETVQMENGAVEFEVGGAEDDFNIGSAGQGEAGNFTIGREQEFGDPAAEKSPYEPSSPSKNSSPGLTSRDDQPEQKPSVKKELQEIKQEQVKKKEEKAKQQDRQHPTPGHSRKKKKKQKGR